MNNKRIFFTLLLLILANTLLVDLLLTKDLYYQSFSDQMPVEMISKLLKFRQKFGWLSFIIAPAIVSIKMAFITGLLYVGSMFSGLENKFRNYWRIVLIAEFVTIIYLFIRTGLLYLYNFQSFDEIQTYLPFSVYGIINKEAIASYFHYPLIFLNLFELFYWLVLAYLLIPLTNYNFSKNIIFIAKTYGSGMIVWISIIVYLSINFAS